MKHFNKREKTANLLFKIIEYGAIAFVLNAFLPNSILGIKSVIIGIFSLGIIYVIALIITPEKENN